MHLTKGRREEVSHRDTHMHTLLALSVYGHNFQTTNLAWSDVCKPTSSLTAAWQSSFKQFVNTADVYSFMRTDIAKWRSHCTHLHSASAPQHKRDWMGLRLKKINKSSKDSSEDTQLLSFLLINFFLTSTSISPCYRYQRCAPQLRRGLLSECKYVCFHSTSFI